MYNAAIHLSVNNTTIVLRDLKKKKKDAFHLQPLSLVTPQRGLSVSDNSSL